MFSGGIEVKHWLKMGQSPLPPSAFHCIFLLIFLGRLVTQNGKILHFFGFFFLFSYQETEEVVRSVLSKRYSYKRTKLAGKHLCWSFFSNNKIADWTPATLWKRSSRTGVFLGLREIFKNTFFIEHVRATASGQRLW